MKAVFILISIALLLLVGRMALQKANTGEQASVAALERMVANFPKSIHRSPDQLSELVDVTYNVRKTDSLSAPIVGTISFAEPLFADEDVRYELIYHWRDGSWDYQGITCLSPEVNTPVFEAQMAATPEIAAFTQGIPLSTIQAPEPTPDPTPVPLTPAQIAQQRAANRERLEQMTRERLNRPATREDEWNRYYQSGH
jgi:hypothetical protein